VEKSTGTVIRLTKLGDSSLIVHWCTREHGVIKTVAKGARAPRSKFAGKIDLFFRAEIDWARARRGELHGLREVTTSATRSGLRREYGSTLLAGYFAGLLGRAVEPDHPVPELHDLLERALDHVAEAGPSLRAMGHFERELARLLGFGGGRSAADSLAEAIGSLPAARREILDRLS
jgi:DNA repair protein RecO (recombination protein O)